VNEDARPITCERIGTSCAAMGDVPENLQTLLEDAVSLAAFDMRDEADTTCVVLVGWIVQTLADWHGRMAHVAPHWL
jgi:hypothetical protein